MRTAALFIVGLLCLAAVPASAQHLIRVRVDTVTGKAGDTVTVNVYYTFSGTKPFDLHAFNAKFDYDTDLAWIAGYQTNGTASAALSIFSESHLGIVCYASSGTDIDFTNPVLFRMRVLLKQALSDTARIRWVSFGTDDPIDSTVEQDGWVRTSFVAAHTVLHAPLRTVYGVFTGPYADSVRFDLPIMITDIASANVTKANLTFAFDRNRLAVESVSSKLAQTTLGISPGTSGAFDTATVAFQTESLIAGSDTLVTIHFFALIGPDTICTSLTNVTWTPLNSDAKRGQTDVDFDSVCPIHLFGVYAPASVESEAQHEPFQLYPNPARDYVISAGSDAITFEMYDALGRLVGRCERSNDMWLVPQSIMSGSYRSVLRLRSGESKISTLVIER